MTYEEIQFIRKLIRLEMNSVLLQACDEREAYKIENDIDDVSKQLAHPRMENK